MNRLWNVLVPSVFCLLLLAAWQLACVMFAVPAYFLPAPSAIFTALLENTPMLVESAGLTLATALQALLIASLTAVSLALLAGLSPTAERALQPLAVAAQVTPVVAIAPLLLIWAGLEHPERAVIALAAVVAFFPIYSGVVAGLRSADPDLSRLFDLYEATRMQRLVRLRLPAAVPALLEGHKVASGLALIGAVVAEFAAGSGKTQGLAWRILEAGNRLQTARMFAALVVLAVTGGCLYAIMTDLERRILQSWRGR